MPNDVYLAFDFGYKRIGMAVGQRLTCSATPLATLKAQAGVPNWQQVEQKIKEWLPKALIVGFPTCIDGRALYTTAASKRFAKELKKRFTLPVYLVDERLSTVEAREQLFAQGGYRKLQQSEVDSVAACVILVQWLQHTSEQNETFS